MGSEEPDDLELDEDMDDDEGEEEIDEEEEEDPEDESDDEEGISAKDRADFESRVMTKDQVYKNLYSGNYRTIPLLTKYEKTRILGIRAQQIAEGAATLVDVGDLRDPKEIARKELNEGKCPFLIVRPLPGRNLRKPINEVRRVSDLIMK
jgi:DNA-directed RNA polymerase subunit K/omega